jgi:hypothetical protein
VLLKFRLLGRQVEFGPAYNGKFDARTPSDLCFLCPRLGNKIYFRAASSAKGLVCVDFTVHHISVLIDLK